MAKRKFLVDGIYSYLGKAHDENTGADITISINLNGKVCEASTEIKTKDNAGQEAWDWAQSHWDEFADRNGPITHTVIDGVVFEIPTELRWICVTGVMDMKGNLLPIKAPVYKKPKNPPSEKVGYYKAPNKSKPKPVSPKPKPATISSYEEFKAAKVKKAMTEE